MTDYRLKPNRRAYFNALYVSTLEHRVHPGLVYIHLTGLVRLHRLDEEDALWLAFLNGITQNPITTWRMFEHLPECTYSETRIVAFAEWFNAEWATLAFDTDRLKNKRLTVNAIEGYVRLVKEAGSQRALFEGKTYAEAYNTISAGVPGFGRLSTFSYLEYVHLLGLGPASDDLFFGDREGSRSHRNGMLFLHGLDELVWDKRLPNGCTGRYRDLPGMARQMAARADQILLDFKHPDAGYNTFESCLCAFKNSFFARRYPGVYADMGWDRVTWYREHGLEEVTRPFVEMREEHLPDWLRIETEARPLPRPERARMFAETGVPFRAQHFLA